MSLVVDLRWLAVCRIALGVALAMDCVEVGAVLSGVAAGELAMPRFADVPITGPAATAWTLANLVAALLLVVGAFVREAASPPPS